MATSSKQHCHRNPGNDTLSSPGGVTSLVNGALGNDTITLNTAADYAVGAEGNDSITLSSALATFTGSVAGADGNDFLISTGAVAAFSGDFAGNKGNDTLRLESVGAFSGNVGGGLGDDSIRVGSGTWSSGALTGGDNADTISILSGTFSNFSITGAKGADSINYAASGAGSSASILAGAGHDTIVIGTGQTAIGITTVFGGAGNDSITMGLVFLLSLLQVVVWLTPSQLALLLKAVLSTVTPWALLPQVLVLVASQTVLISSAAPPVFCSNIRLWRRWRRHHQFLPAAAAISINGGANADFIRVVEADSALSFRWYGVDTITINSAASASSVSGGAGHDHDPQRQWFNIASNLAAGGTDTVKFLLNAAANATIDGGSQNDIITSTGVGTNGAGSINGGNGVDTISSWTSVEPSPSPAVLEMTPFRSPTSPVVLVLVNPTSSTAALEPTPFSLVELLPI